MTAQPLDEVRPSDDDSRLRPSEQLVSREADEVGAGARGSPPESARLRTPGSAPIRGRRRAASRALRDRRRARASPGRSVKPDDPEVRLVHPEEDGRLGPDRALVVGGARPVRRPDLDEPRARAREDVRDPEAVADLDSSPRETTTSRPSASAASASRTAAALLLTTSAASAPVSRRSSRRGDPGASPALRARGRTRGSSSRSRSRRRARAPPRREAPGRGSCARSRRSH